MGFYRKFGYFVATFEVVVDDMMIDLVCVQIYIILYCFLYFLVRFE